VRGGAISPFVQWLYQPSFTGCSGGTWNARLVKTLLALISLFAVCSLSLVVGAFISEGRREAARTGLQLLTLAVCAFLFSLVLHAGTGAIGF
jgi:predicted Na+-dependent transporter